jgi:hypothetical protein
MKTIRSVADYELTWSQQSLFKNEFELRWGGELVATLRLPKMIGTMGVAESEDGSWSFERKGFWKSRTIVTPTGATEPIGTFLNNRWGMGGTLELADGTRFAYWRSVWKSLSEFRTDAGEPLFQIKQHTALKVSATMRINRKALSFPELPWLALFAFYLIVMARSDAATHAAAS